MPRVFKFLFPASLVVFCLVNIMTMNDGHNWGDDFAQYILHAVNIVQHRPYAENIALGLWTVVPPGFPLLLASLIYWFGTNLIVLKYLNILFWGLSALAVYFLSSRKFPSPWPQVLAIWFLSTPMFFGFKQNILSDIPFMCFCLLSVWAYCQYEEAEDKGQNSRQLFYALAIFLMSYAFLIRSAGIILFLSVILHLGLMKRKWGPLAGFIFGMFAAFAVQYLFGASPAGHFSQGQFSLQAWVGMLWANLFYLPTVWGDFLIFKAVLPQKFVLVFSWTLQIMGPAIFLVMTVIFIQRFIQKKLGFWGCFTFLYFLGMVVWPVQQGAPRYILPVFVSLTIYTLASIKSLFKSPVVEKVLIGVLMALIVQNVYSISSNFRFNDDDIYKKESLEMAGWVMKNIPADQHYMFYKPRALALLTQRTGAAFWVYPQDRDRWYERIEPLGVRYLVADKQLDQIARYDAFRFPSGGHSLDFSLVWQNSRYKIFKMN
jgi:hypothetical protein